MDKPFSWYEANGYEGRDCSLEISLYEYGLMRWAAGGPIIEREKIATDGIEKDGYVHT